MKLLSLAVCSLGIWIFLGTIVDGEWVSIVFGILTALLALGGAFVKSD